MLSGPPVVAGYRGNCAGPPPKGGKPAQFRAAHRGRRSAQELEGPFALLDGREDVRTDAHPGAGPAVDQHVVGRHPIGHRRLVGDPDHDRRPPPFGSRSGVHDEAPGLGAVDQILGEVKAPLPDAIDPIRSIRRYDASAATSAEPWACRGRSAASTPRCNGLARDRR